MYWEEAAYVLANRIRLRIMETLASSAKPLTPKEISKLSDIGLSNVSTKLIELKKKKLIVCLNPEAKKFRLYTLTSSGRKIFEKVKEMKS